MGSGTQRLPGAGGVHPRTAAGVLKRTVAIETRPGGRRRSASPPKERMRADDRASLETRQRKDRTLTPERLRARWADEAATVGIPTARGGRRTGVSPDVTSRTAGPGGGVRRAGGPRDGAVRDPGPVRGGPRRRAGRRHGAGRLTVDRDRGLAAVPASRTGGATRPRDGTGSAAAAGVVHRRAARLEDRVSRPNWPTCAAHRSGCACDDEAVEAPRARGLGRDRRTACGLLCSRSAGGPDAGRPGRARQDRPQVAAARRWRGGRPVVAMATTNKAVAELRAVGLDAETIARFRLAGDQVSPVVGGDRR